DRRDERLLDQRLLFGDVGGEMPAGRRGRAHASGITERALADRGLQVMLDLVPGALVHRFLLAPDDFLRGLEAVEFVANLAARERIELLDAYDRGIIELPFRRVFGQIVVD